MSSSLYAPAPWWQKLKDRGIEVSRLFQAAVPELVKVKNLDDLGNVVRKTGILLFRVCVGGRKALVLGPQGSGKTSLQNFLQSGYPGNPRPTGEAKESGKNGLLWETGDVVTFGADVGGEPDYRGDWRDVVAGENPEAIIYMVDGREDFDVLKSDIDDAFKDILFGYQGNIRALRTFYIFVNFYDEWKTDPSKKVALAPKLRAYFEEIRSQHEILQNLNVQAYETQLSPSGRPWDEVGKALNHFAVDLRED